jgi:hypothetical protein
MDVGGHLLDFVGREAKKFGRRCQEHPFEFRPGGRIAFKGDLFFSSARLS